MKRSDGDVSLNHDVMGYGIMFTPQVTPTFQIWGQLGQCNGIRVQAYALRGNTNGSNTLYTSNKDMGSSLRWISASTVT